MKRSWQPVPLALAIWFAAASGAFAEGPASFFARLNPFKSSTGVSNDVQFNSLGSGDRAAVRQVSANGERRTVHAAQAVSHQPLPESIGSPPAADVADAEFETSDWPSNNAPLPQNGAPVTQRRLTDFFASSSSDDNRPLQVTPVNDEPPIFADPDTRSREEEIEEYPFPFNALGDDIFIRDPADDEPLGVIGRQLVPPATVDTQMPGPGDPLGGDMFPMEDRWRIGFPEWDRWARSSLANPYRASVLKGDFPLFGRDQIFNAFTIVSDSVLASKDVAQAGGKVNQRAFQQTIFITYDLFKEDNTFIPSPWFISATPALQVTDGGGDQSALQVAFADFQMAITSDYYDEVRLRLGRQAFNSDFLGFVFVDANDAVRLFWTKEAKRTFGDLVFFSQVQKEGGFNSFTSREQQIAIARVQRQDFIFPGFNALISFLYDNDDFQQSVDAYFLELAWAGRLGRVETTGAFVQAWGHDTNNPVAERPINANAQLVAAEVAYPMDWIKPKISALYASGDRNPMDGKGTAFDSVFDNPNFAGNGFSYLNREAVAIGGQTVFNTFSLFPNLRTKANQPSNFVNPGITVFNVGFETVLSARTIAFADANYFRYVHTQPLEKVFMKADVPKTVGLEIGGGVVYKPFIVNNVQIVVGASVFNPGSGMTALTGDSRYLYTAFSAFTYIY